MKALPEWARKIWDQMSMSGSVGSHYASSLWQDDKSNYRQLCHFTGILIREVELMRSVENEEVKNLREQVSALQAGIEQLRTIRNDVYMSQGGWIYQGDDDDHLESLTCPVVIQPKDLISLKSKLEQLKEALRVQGGCRMLSEGEQCDCGLCKRDAEIARLKAKAKQYLDDYTTYVKGSRVVSDDDLAKLRSAQAEIEGLRADATLYTLDINARNEQISALFAEIERLRASLPKTRNGVTITRGMTVYSDAYPHGTFEVTVTEMRLYPDGEWWIGEGSRANWKADRFYDTIEAAEAAKRQLPEQ